MLRQVLLLSGFCLLLNGCGLHKLYLTPQGFTQLPEHESIWYETGARDKALVVAQVLDRKMIEVIRKQYRPFATPVRIYLCSTEATFSKYVLHPKAGGETQGGRKMLISPKKVNTNERLPRLVTHELSHYHLFGHTGIYRGSILPAWFVEGLATWVSGGAGAERVSAAEARSAILAGNSFHLTMPSSLLFGRHSKPQGMQEHMFYRQSGMFVGYLHDSNPEGFRKLLLEIEDKKNFRKSFQKSYGLSAENAWQDFSQKLASRAEDGV